MIQDVFQELSRGIFLKLKLATVYYDTYKKTKTAQKYLDLSAVKQNLFHASPAIILHTMDFQTPELFDAASRVIIRKNDQSYSKVCSFIYTQNHKYFVHSAHRLFSSIEHTVQNTKHSIVLLVFIRKVIGRNSPARWQAKISSNKDN